MPNRAHWHRLVFKPKVNDPVVKFPYGYVCQNKQLQDGSEGVVQLWQHEHSKILLAVKVIPYTKLIPNEARILQALPDHDSIIKYLGYHEKQPSPSKTSIMLEYCTAGDLNDFRHRSSAINNSTFSEAFMWKLFSQLASAVAFLHEGINVQNLLGADEWKPVVHRDIKPENIFIKALGAK